MRRVLVHRKPLGITLVETLVVIAILGVSIALILPAVQFARERARQSQCRGRLAQVGQAMLSYHESHKVFPPGITAEGVGPPREEDCNFLAVSATCDYPTESHVSGLTLLLPYLEENSVYRAYNMQVACCAKENSTATSSTIRGFVCPSNPLQFRSIGLAYYGSSAGVGPTDYVLSLGGIGQLDCSNPFAISTGGPPSRYPGVMKRAIGAFGVNSSVSIDKLRDGRANTLLMGESAGGAELFVGLAGTSVVSGAQRMTAASTSGVCDNPWSMAFIASRNGNAGYGSVFGATAWNAWYDTNGNLTDPANGKNWFPYPINEGGLKFTRPTWALNTRAAIVRAAVDGTALPSAHGSTQGFRSYHRGRANFLLGDGSVRSFSESIDARILVAYSSVVGREPLELDE